MQPTTTPRANRIPRIAPKQPSLFRRLLSALTRAAVAIKRLYLEWLLYSLGAQLDDVETLLMVATTQAAKNAIRHRVDRQLDARRRDLRRQQAVIGSRMLEVRKELDNLQAAL